jgi:NitT/TauT family transport system permease protein
MKNHPISSDETSAKIHFELIEVVHILAILSIALFLWELGVIVTKIPPYLLPQPSIIIRTLWSQLWYYIRSSLVTLGEAIIGLMLGMLVGVFLACGITLWRRLARGVLVLAILVKATPIVAIAPLLIILFGFGPVPKVIVTGLITFFPVLVNVHTGLNAVDQSIMDLFYSLNANRWEILWHARWQSALPYLFAALKVSGPLAFVGAVVAEWAGASAGLGRAMWLAYTNLNMPALFSAIFCSAVMGIGIYLFINILESRIIYW